MARPRVTDADKIEATRLALTGVARGVDANDLVAELARLHPRNNTFPGELLLELAVDALEVAGVNRAQPLDYQGLFERFLPECAFRGKSDHQKRHYALRAVAMIHGGVRPDLLEETAWWSTDDFWLFAVFAFVIAVRAAADRSRESTSVVASRVAARRNLELVIT